MFKFLVSTSLGRFLKNGHIDRKYCQYSSEFPSASLQSSLCASKRAKRIITNKEKGQENLLICFIFLYIVLFLIPISVE